MTGKRTFRLFGRKCVLRGGGHSTPDETANDNTASHDYSSILGGSTQSTSSSSQTIPALP